VNRVDAGRQLAAALQKLKGEPMVVLALPRGGVPVAFEVAKKLEAPLDLIMVRKIGAPFQPELALGAVADGPHPQQTLNQEIVNEFHVPADFIKGEVRRQLAEIERRRKLYFGHIERPTLVGKTAIVIDDGIATGATVRAALRSVRKAGASRIVVAVPVAPPEVVTMLREEADEVICVVQPDYLGAIGEFYEDFRQVSDDEVIDLLDKAKEVGQSRVEVPRG